MLIVKVLSNLTKNETEFESKNGKKMKLVTVLVSSPFFEATEKGEVVHSGTKVLKALCPSSLQVENGFYHVSISNRNNMGTAYFINGKAS